MTPPIIYENQMLLELPGPVNKPDPPAEMKLCLPTLKGFTVIKVDDIVCCEAQRSYTLFRLSANRPILIAKPLFNYEKLLSGGNFLRVHKSYLINLFHIREYIRSDGGGTLVMSNGLEIEVSRRRKEEFMLRIREVFKF